MLHDITLDGGTLFTVKEVWVEHVARAPAGPLNISPPDAGVGGGGVERWGDAGLGDAGAMSLLKVQLRCQLGDNTLPGWAPSSAP